ncbi:type II toxin-antitoxin system Phd/YefM family antitoxin [Collinsella tanakaei]|uniref:type II toxin-antitoxin system Phd/YefM family antitoxin n=1 Tax=Collinsella tanakaei TaxID=626935 RepID=UPI003AB44FDE
MKSVPLAAFWDSMGSYIKQVHAAGQPILVTCEDPRSNIVIKSAHDYENLMENLYVLSNEYLSRKIDRGLAQTREGKLQIHELVEVESD